MLETLLPHRGDALFLRDIVTHDATSLCALASVPRSSAYADDGAVDALLAFEIAAQAAAAHGGLSGAGTAPAAAPGFLVGVKALELVAATFPAERKVPVRVRLLGRAQQLASWSFEFGEPTAVIARGEFSVWTA